MTIKAMEQAIDALNEAVAFREGGRQKAIDAITALRTAITQAEAQQPATTEPVVSRNPFASRCYTMSESHLSGHRLIVGFEKLGDVQDAHEWVARQARGDFTHPAPGVPDGWKLVRYPITEGMHAAACKALIRSHGLSGVPQRMLTAMLAASPALRGHHQDMS